MTLNINYGKNQQLMNACEPLKEFAWLVEAVRQHQEEKMYLDAAVDAAVDATLDELSDKYVIKEFLIKNRAEAKSMFLTQYSQEKVLQKERQEGVREGVQEEKQEIASRMLKEGTCTVSYISEMTELSEDAVRKLAKSIGVAAL